MLKLARLASLFSATRLGRTTRYAVTIAALAPAVHAAADLLAAPNPPAPAAGMSAPAPAANAATRWVDAWATSFLPTLRNGTLDAVPTFSNQTLRLVVFSKLAGTQARVRLTNKFQTTPLKIGAAHIALRDGAQGGAITPDTDRALTFGGKPAVTLAPGEELWSDPVTLAVPQHADVAISVFLPDEGYKPAATHGTGLKTSFLSAPGDHTGDASMPPPSAPAGGAPGAGRGPGRGRGPGGGTTNMTFFVNDLQVMAPAKTRVIVAFGDSITDGAVSQNDGNASWPDVLSKRLPRLPDGTPVSVINMGIGSNRLVASDQAGPAGVKRFADDVLARPNVTHLIVLEGVNDISYEHVKPEQLIAAYQDVIARAHAKGIKVFGATILPIQNSTKDTPENEATRQSVNKWIRESKAFDAVIEFEKIVQDPVNPLRIRADLTGDYVHPNTTGY
ncbi:MAG: SGNH/GDSL hydrolase family protein [Verrucomicrobiota bacterium]